MKNARILRIVFGLAVVAGLARLTFAQQAPAIAETVRSQSGIPHHLPGEPERNRAPAVGGEHDRARSSRYPLLEVVRPRYRLALAPGTGSVASARPARLEQPGA